VTTAFDVETAGVATLSYVTPGTRAAVLVFQLLLWVAAFFGATRVSVPLARRRGPLVTDETLITFDDDTLIDDDGLPVGIDPGLDMTGQIARDRAEQPAEEPLTDPVDEHSWVDDLMADAVEDPIPLTEDNESPSELPTESPSDPSIELEDDR
jgi:hypothetical protein